MPPSGPWVSPKAPKLKYAESKQFSRHFDTKHAKLSSMFALKETAEEIIKGKARFVRRWYSIWPG